MLHSQKAFTLLEVLVALAILAGSLTTLVMVYNNHLSIVIRDREETTALLLAREMIDDPLFLSTSETKGDFAPNHPGFTWQRQVTRDKYPGVDRYRLIVLWQNGSRNLALVRYERH